MMAAFTILGPSGPFFVPLVMACVAMAMAFLLASSAELEANGSQLAGGLLATAVVAVDPIFAAYAMQPMSDVPATAWLLASIWASQDRHKQQELGWLAAAGFFGGMAILTRPALTPAVAVLIWLRARRSTRARIVIGGIVAGFVAAQLLLNLALYGNAEVSGYGTVSHMFELSGSRLMANIANFGKWLTHSHTLLFWLLWPGSMWILRKERSAWDLSAIAAAAALPYLFYVVFDDWESSRFLLPAIVLVLVLFARALTVTLSEHLSHPSHLSHLVVVVLAFAWAFTAHNFLEREGVYRFASVESKYALVGEWFKTHTPERAVVLAGLHSGSIRLYGQRETVRWDQIPEDKLEATLRNLRDRGYEPYLALDVPSEPPLFQARFGPQRAAAAEQIARVRVVNIYRFVSAH